MAQWLRAHTFLAEDPSSVLITYFRQLTTNCNSSSNTSKASGPQLQLLSYFPTDRDTHIKQQQQNQHV